MKKFLFSFLICCLFFVNVSNAEFSVYGTEYGDNLGKTGVYTFQLTENYTLYNVWSIVKQHYLGDLSDSIYNVMFEELRSNGFGFTFSDYNDIFEVVVYSYEAVDIGYYNNYIQFTQSGTESTTIYSQVSDRYSRSKITVENKSYSSVYEPIYITDSVKLLTCSGGYVYWDGESYYYQAEISTPDTPVLDSETANVIQKFYDSDYYKENKDFRDFYILHTPSTGYYSIIGTQRLLNQYMVEAGVKLGYEEESYDVDWWFFDTAHDVLTNLYYWLYSTTDNGDTFAYDGKGLINDLCNVRFTTGSSIVYSTRDYNCIRYFLTEDEDGTKYTAIDYEYIETGSYEFSSELTPTENNYSTFGEMIVDKGTSLLSDVTSGSFFEGLGNLMTSWVNAILTGLKNLFIPDFTYLSETWTRFKEKTQFINQSIDIVNNIVDGIELNPLAPPSISIDLSNANSKYNWGGEVMALDLSWYEPYKPAVDFIIICFCYGYFIWNLFKDLPNILAGVAGAGVSYNSSEMRANYISDRNQREARRMNKSKYR